MVVQQKDRKIMRERAESERVANVNVDVVFKYLHYIHSIFSRITLLPRTFKSALGFALDFYSY